MLTKPVYIYIGLIWSEKRLFLQWFQRIVVSTIVFLFFTRTKIQFDKNRLVIDSKLVAENGLEFEEI